MTTNNVIYGTLTVKNFLSFGNDTITLVLNSPGITVVLGQNLDTGGEDSRNGVGKSAFIDALAYVIFGTSIRGASNSKIVHKFKRKNQNMLVTLTFTKGEWAYYVERGEAPSRFKFYRRPIDSTEDWDTKEKNAEGKLVPKYDITLKKTESKNEIVKLFGYDINLFEYLVVNSSETTPFLKLSEEKKRDIIEKLFGFSILSERAEYLKEIRKDLSKNLVVLESTAAATEAANKRIRDQIVQITKRSDEWEAKKKQAISDYEESISTMEKVDTQEEIEYHKLKAELTQLASEQKQKKITINTELLTITTTIKRNSKDITSFENELNHIQHQLLDITEETCPTCKQHWEADPNAKKEFSNKEKKLKTDIKNLKEQNEDLSKKEITLRNDLINIDAEVKDTISALDEVNQYPFVYGDIFEAMNMTGLLSNLKEHLEEERQSKNPHINAIDDLNNNAIQVVNHKEVEDLRLLIDHYNLVIELLTKKDSYIRKKIIDRWLPQLNIKIADYLKAMTLPHKIRINSDLTVSISIHNQDYDYTLLSKGERARLTIALNFAFQDIFATMNYDTNLLLVDELIDSGICNRGAENVVDMLKDLIRRKKKKVMLVTHREDIASRIDNVMLVTKENDQSRIDFI